MQAHAGQAVQVHLLGVLVFQHVPVAGELEGNNSEYLDIERNLLGNYPPKKPTFLRSKSFMAAVSGHALVLAYIEAAATAAAASVDATEVAQMATNAAANCSASGACISVERSVPIGHDCVRASPFYGERESTEMIPVLSRGLKATHTCPHTVGVAHNNQCYFCT